MIILIRIDSRPATDERIDSGERSAFPRMSSCCSSGQQRAMARMSVSLRIRAEVSRSRTRAGHRSTSSTIPELGWIGLVWDGMGWVGFGLDLGGLG